jgi:hypothetical protein
LSAAVDVGLRFSNQINIKGGGQECPPHTASLQRFVLQSGISWPLLPSQLKT